MIITRRGFIAAIVCANLSGSHWIAPSLAAEAAVVVNSAVEAESRILNDIRYLAGDELEGRGIGTAGIDKAASFLAEEFRQLGLLTDLYPSGPFQEFTVKAGVTMGEPTENHLTLIGPAADSRDEWKLQRDFTPLAIGSSGEFQGELVFVGYGITSTKLGYDDYAGLDVKDKVVLILRKEPQQDDPHSVFDGKRSSVHAQFRRKIQNAVKHGAAAVILVNDNKTTEEKRREIRKQASGRWKDIDQLLVDLRSSIDREEPAKGDTQDARQSDEDRAGEATREASSGDTIAAAVEALAKQVDELRETYREVDDGNFDPLLDFLGAGTQSEGSIPVFFATRQQVDKVLSKSLNTNLLAIEQGIDDDLTSRSQILDGWKVAGAAKVIQQSKGVRNVIAVLEGEGPLAEETVVIGAHYDHLGRGGPGTLAPWTVAIHNGADDNASGTSALMEVARVFASRDEQPKRRMVFVAFTGEESGLLGSAHYVREPRFPLEETVAMVNLDMVGRLKNNALFLEGTGTAKQFDALIDRVNETHEFNIKKKASGYGPSDHASFYGKKVPVLFLFTGLHNDYHRPGDDWDKINVQGVRRVVDFAVDILDELVMTESKPSYVELRRGGRLARDGNRVILGIIPDMTSPEEGLVIRQLSEKGPAELAGLQQGDVITNVDESPINSLTDLRSVLAKHKADDEISVTVTRGGEQMTIDVKLQSGG